MKFNPLQQVLERQKEEKKRMLQDLITGHDRALDLIATVLVENAESLKKTDNLANLVAIHNAVKGKREEKKGIS